MRCVFALCKLAVGADPSAWFEGWGAYPYRKQKKRTKPLISATPKQSIKVRAPLNISNAPWQNTKAPRYFKIYSCLKSEKGRQFFFLFRGIPFTFKELHTFRMDKKYLNVPSNWSIIKYLFVLRRPEECLTPSISLSVEYVRINPPLDPLLTNKWNVEGCTYFQWWFVMEASHHSIS